MNCVYAMFDDYPIHGHDEKSIEWKSCKYFGRTQHITERIGQHKCKSKSGIIRKIEEEYGKCVMIFWDAGSCADMMLTELFMILKLKPEFNAESNMDDMNLTCNLSIQKFALHKLSPYRCEVAYITNGVCITNKRKHKVED